MPPLSPVRLISAATAFLGLGEESTGTGVGRFVSLCLAEVGQPPGHPWDTAFVHHVGYWSHYENEVDWSAWPLPRSATAEASRGSRRRSTSSTTRRNWATLRWSPARRRERSRASASWCAAAA
jgi:hypothetical protein